MPFTLQELDNITNAAIDFHLNKGKVHSQSIQEKPLLNAMLAKKKTFPGGKENITVRVKGVYTTTIQGFTHNDTVNYSNPANIKTAVYPWKEWHSGIEVTMTELKKDGISVVDSTTGAKTSMHSDREMTALANLLDDKLEDMSEGSARGNNLMLWRDGTADPKLPAGIKHFVVDDPTAAVLVGGIDQSANTWWRNRASLGIAATVAGAANQTLTNALIPEVRQLRRYGGKPTFAPSGSDFLDVLEAELRAKGTYTQTGWKDKGSIEISQPDAELKGVMFKYDPTLDDEGESKRSYFLDLDSIFPDFMDSEYEKNHAPARPENKYVIYRALTWTGGVVARRRNSSGVYSIA